MKGTENVIVQSGDHIPNFILKELYGENRSYMSVEEMGDLLGLKKTDRYWLMHKGFFKTCVVGRKTWISIASFEKWYANQVKYRKVEGEPPGRELKKRSYSARDIADLLGISEAFAYSLIKTNGMPTVLVDGWRRVPREDFEKWYEGQSRYRNKKERRHDAEAEEASLSMPEMARLLGVRRSVVYGILKSEKYRDVLQVIVIADRKRITKESFEKFLSMQDRYQIHEVCEEEPETVADDAPTGGRHNPEFMTRAEAAQMANVSESRIMAWADAGYFSERKIGAIIRISRKEFTEWLQSRERKA